MKDIILQFISNLFPTGKPNILNLWVQNSVGLVSTSSSAAVVIDTTPPDGGTVECPTFVAVSI